MHGTTGDVCNASLSASADPGLARPSIQSATSKGKLITNNAGHLDDLHCNHSGGGGEFADWLRSLTAWQHRK